VVGPTAELEEIKSPKQWQQVGRRHGSFLLDFFKKQLIFFIFSNI
jgi:hypothetical protein